MREMSIITDNKPNLYKAGWLSRQNHKENKDVEIPCMQLDIDTIETATNIPEFITIHELQQATSQDERLQHL